MKHKISNNTLVLMHKGKRLNNNLSLADNNIGDGTIVYVAGDIGEDKEIVVNRSKKKKRKKGKGKKKKRRV